MRRTLTLAATVVALIVALAPSSVAQAKLGPIRCHTIRCTQDRTVTRQWLDTDQLVTIVSRHSRPTNTRNSITAPWGRWHLVVAYIHRDPQTMTKSEWNQVAIGDKRVADVRELCGCIETATSYHRDWHGNDYKAYEYLTPVGNAFVFFRVNAAGDSIAGFQKDWCPGQPVVHIPTGDCQSAWN